MVESSATRVWGMRTIYVALALVVLFAHLVPLQIPPQRFAAPDILTALTFAWAIRRPDYVPMLLIAAVMLLADMLLQRPPGLWSALVLIAAEQLKSQDRRIRDSGFVAEWLTVAGMLLVITVIYRVLLGLLIVAPGTLFLAVMQFVTTLLVYPGVTAFGAFLFDVRHSTPSDVDPLRRG